MTIFTDTDTLTPDEINEEFKQIDENGGETDKV